MNLVHYGADDLIVFVSSCFIRFRYRDQLLVDFTVLRVHLE